MIDIIFAGSLGVLTVGFVLLAVALHRAEKRLTEAEAVLSKLANLQAHAIRSLTSVVESQDKLNASLFEVVSAHHVALRMPTGIADEISNYLRDKEKDN